MNNKEEAILQLIEEDIENGRVVPVCPVYVEDIKRLVEGVEIDLNAPLSLDDE